MAKIVDRLHYQYLASRLYSSPSSGKVAILPKVTSRHAAAASVRSVAEPLQRALFSVSEDVLVARAAITPEELERRAIISTAVKYTVKQRAYKEKSQIRQILIARGEALNELNKISPNLYRLATSSHLIKGVPLERRMLTLHPPTHDPTLNY